MKNRLENGDALLIIDAQNDFFPGGSLPVPKGDEIIPVVNAWINAAQEKNIPIFASRDWHPPNHCSFNTQGGPWPHHCVQNSEGAKIHPDINMPNDAIIVDTADNPNKEGYSAFSGHTHENEKLNDVMNQKKIRRVWVVGLALDYCVLESALDARKNHFDVHVLLDGTMPITEETGNEALRKLRDAGVIIETNSEPYL